MNLSDYDFGELVKATYTPLGVTEEEHNSSVPADYFYYWSSEKIPTISSFCAHDWKQYVGLTEVYKFCVKCDEKDFGDGR
jgi:hypothetical protein